MELTDMEPRFEIRLMQRSGILTVIEVLAPGRRSTLEAVSSELFRLRVQIARGECFVEEGHLIERFHVVEFDGGVLAKRRVSEALEAIRHRLASEPPQPALRWAHRPEPSPVVVTLQASP